MRKGNEVRTEPPKKETFMFMLMLVLVLVGEVGLKEQEV